jgi:hypothetical protein
MEKSDLDPAIGCLVGLGLSTALLLAIVVGLWLLLR